MKKTGMVAVVPIAVFVCLLLCTPALADYNFDGWPVVTNTSGTVHGTVFVGYEPWKSTTTLTGNFDVPSGTVKWARLYTGVWGGTNQYTGWVNVTFNDDCTSNGLGPIHLEGVNDNNSNVWCTGCGKYWMWYNVTDLAEPGSTNTATASKINGTIDGRIYGIVLVAVLENESASQVRYWINDGSEALHYTYGPHPEKNEGTTNFDGSVNVANLTSAALTMVHLTAHEPACNNCLKFNDNPLDTSMVDSNDFELNSWDVKDYMETSANDAWFSRGSDMYVNVVNAILVLNAPFAPDLTVPEIKDPVLAGHDYTLDVVANHTYTINATIRNNGIRTATNVSNATLHANGVLIDTQPVPSLIAGETAEVQFTWSPTSPGTYKLNVTADAFDQVDESGIETGETNNVGTKDVEVLTEGDPDLAMSSNDLIFMPTYKWHDADNRTSFVVNVSNVGTGDANNFNVQVLVDAGSGFVLHETETDMTVKARGVKVISFTPYDAAYGNEYDVKAVLDADSDVTEPGKEGNNDITRTLEVIQVRIRDTHHWGDNSTYNSAEMFDVVKLVPANTTAWEALKSVATVKQHPEKPPGNTFVYGIDGLDLDATVVSYWYLYMNGRYVHLNDLCGVIELQDNETIHWDYQRQVYVYVTSAVSGLTPASTVQSYNDLYPEPFTHGFPMSLEEDDNGFSRTIWNTTIVYPAESSEYPGIAGNVKNKLIAKGVSAEKISTANDTSVTNEQKENNSLILLGTYTANSIIAELNPYHEYFGMVIYKSGDELFDDSTDKTYTHGEVVQVFDNPYDNGPLGTNKSYCIEGPVILMASGLDNACAKEAANMLVNRTDELDWFWKVAPERSYSVDLVTGSNYISLPLVPDDNSTSSALSSIAEKYSYVYRLNPTTKAFEKYNPALPAPFNDFNEIDPGRLYDVVATEDCVWSHEGTTPANMNILMYTGSNYVGWPSMNPENVADAMTSIAGKYSYVYRLSPTTKAFEKYNPALPAPFNDFNEMEPKRGYDIVATQDCTWTAPPDC